MFQVRKFVCTTIRPTEFPYRELYNVEECASFIANFLEVRIFHLSRSPKPAE